MTEEDRKLLLKDLSARLTYGVKISLKNSEAYHHENVAKKGDITIDKLKGFNGSYFSIYHDNPLDWDWYVSDIDVEDVKPYLYPLSSMTEEQKKEYNFLRDFVPTYHYEYGDIVEDTALYDNCDSIDYLNAHHFDYRGLIEKGLAIDATGLNIY